MKSPFRLPPSAFCVVLAAFVIQHSAFGIAAEPPPAAAQGGVQLWEDGPRWADRNVGAEEPWEAGLYFWWSDAVGCTWRLRFGAREIGTNFCWDRYIATPVRPVRDE